MLHPLFLHFLLGGHRQIAAILPRAMETAGGAQFVGDQRELKNKSLGTHWVLEL